MTAGTATEGERVRRGNDTRLVSIAVGAGIAVLLLTFALVFSNAFGAAQVAANARALHWTNSGLGAAAVARAANSQAVVFAIDHDLGVASADSADAARQEAEATLRNAAIRLSDAETAGADPTLVPLLEGFVTAGGNVIELLERGDVAAAADLNRAGLEDAYSAVRERFSAELDVITEKIANTENAAGRVGMITRVVITLLIPAAALVVYRLIVRRQAQRRELRLQSKLEAERELRRAKDEFIAGISHEFRTPLTSIYGFSEVLVDQGLVDPESAMELIAVINEESGELSRMVEDLLAAARIDADALQFHASDANPRAEVESVVNTFRRGGADIEVSCAESAIRVDPVRFRQVIRNLVSNAKRHGGEHIAVRGRVDGDRYVCVVSDDGAGIPEHLQDRLFQRFVHRGDQPLLTGSVGLGLAVAHSITAEMAGTLDYRRVDGETRFIVTVPLAADLRAPISTGVDRPIGSMVTVFSEEDRGSLGRAQ